MNRTVAAHPPIEACRMAARWTRGEQLFVWVFRGAAEVVLATGETVALAAGEGLWVPETVDRSIRTMAGTVAFPLPIRPGAAPGAPDVPVRFSVPPEWMDWLIQQYVQRISPITHVGSDPTAVLSLLPGTESSASPTVGQVSYPRLPRSDPAATVARELSRNPALDQTLEEWAEMTSCSPSTLRRHFVASTGLTFGRWRTRWRLATARGFLAAGYDVSWVAAQVGFTSRRGFTATFRAEQGCTPTEYARQVGAGSMGDAATPVRSLVELVASGPSPSRAGEAPTVPATYTAPRVNDFHVLIWQYRGNGHARVGDKKLQRRRGDATWLPAGVENQTSSSWGSVTVPISDVYPSDATMAAPLQAAFPESWDAYLLYCSVTSYMMLRPDGYDRRHVLGLFERQLAAQRSAAVRVPRNPPARTVAVEFLRHLDGQGRGPRAVVGADVNESFRRETGMTYARGRHAMRMIVARDLLAVGVSPGSVASRLGYRHVSSFSRACSRFHGDSPRSHHLRRTGQGK